MKRTSTKNVFMILVAILLVGGAFVVAEYRNKQSAKLIYTGTTIATSSGLQDYENAVDWKNVLLATDKNSTSTIKDITKKPEKLTPVDILGRDFFARYVELQRTGNVDDPTSQQTLINQVLQNGFVVNNPKAYVSTDILVKDDNSAVAIKQYSNDLGMILKKYSVESRNEAVITQEALQKSDPKILNELDPILASYRNILSNALRVQVPQTLAKNHLDFINLMSSSVFMIENFKKSMEDPVAGIQAVSIEVKNSENAISIFDKIRTTLSANNITFTNSEGGSIFTPQ